MRGENDMGKKLVAWFSASGVTAKVAQELAAVENADCFEIKPEAPYTPKDLDYTNRQSRSTLEMSDLNCRPATLGLVENMAQYDVVFVGFPIWWGLEPSVVDTFLTSYDFSGKRIVPFCTSGGSGIGRSGPNMEALAGSGTWLEGERFSGGVSEEELKNWIEGLQ
jgi:flavodoxin